MGNGMFVAGWILIATGLLLGIVSVGLIGGAVLRDKEEVEVADENDFSLTWTDSYEFRVRSTDATEHIRIDISSGTGDSISLKVEVVDPDGTVIFEREGTTSMYFEVDISDDFSDYWDVIIEFRDDGHTMSDLSVKVTADEISDATAIMCCFGAVLPVIGLLMMIVGIILLVVGRKKKKPVKSRHPPVYRNTGNRYDPSPSGQFHDHGDTVRRDRNPYYQGSRIPGTVEAPPGYDERTRDL